MARIPAPSPSSIPSDCDKVELKPIVLYDTKKGPDHGRAPRTVRGLAWPGCGPCLQKDPQGLGREGSPPHGEATEFPSRLPRGTLEMLRFLIERLVRLIAVLVAIT